MKIHKNSYFHSPEISHVNFYSKGMEVVLLYQDDFQPDWDGKTVGKSVELIYGEGVNLEYQLLDFYKNLRTFINTFYSSNCIQPKRRSIYPIKIDNHKFTCNVLMTQLKIILQQEGILDGQFRPL